MGGAPPEKWKALYLHGETAASVAPYVTSGAFVVPGGDLGFSVIVFCCCAVLTLSVLLIRRKKYGGELGGPAGPMWCTFGVLCFLWLTYVMMSEAKDKGWV